MSRIENLAKLDGVKIINDLNFDTKEKMENEENTNEDKVAALKEKLNSILKQKAAEQKEDEPTIQKSLKFGVVAVGQAGSRIGEIFYNLGYNVIVANTATQDLVHIKIPEYKKLFMDIGLQGAAKNIDRGQEAAEKYREELSSVISNMAETTDVFIVTSSCGGGSGAGALPVVIDIIQITGKPIVVIGILPMVSEDVKTKSNTIETFSKLANFVKEGKVQNVIVIDNARIEAILAGVSQMEFYNIANKTIVNPIDVFNTFSMMPSNVKSLDSSEWATLLLNGEGLSIYGKVSLTDFVEDTSLAEGIVLSLSDNLLASSFELKDAKYVGFLLIANSNVWNRIPAGSVNYCSIMIADLFGDPEGLFKGIYVDNSLEDDVVQVYTFVSGLSVPQVRLDGLKKEVEAQQNAIKEKNKDRASKLNIDINKNTAVTDIEKLKSKIAGKMSGFGKLTGTMNVVDRRGGK